MNNGIGDSNNNRVSSVSTVKKTVNLLDCIEDDDLDPSALPKPVPLFLQLAKEKLFNFE
jgi:hypothetical protein